MNRTLGPGVGLGIGLLAVLLVVNAAVSYRNTRQLGVDARWVAHTHEVLDALDAVRGAVREAESAHRGYILTGDPADLGHFQAAVDRTAERVERVARLTEDNPRQQAEIPPLRAAVVRETDALARTAAFVEQGDPAAARDAVRDGDIRSPSADLQALVAGMADEERALLHAREETTRQTYRVAVASGLLAAAVGLGAVGLLVWLLNRHGHETARAAAALAAEQERFRATFEQAAVGLAHVAPDGRWLRVNRRLAEKLGYTTAELAGLTFQDVTYPPDLDADEGEARRLLAGKVASYAMEKRYVRKDGSRVWANLTVSLVRRPDGSPDYFIAVVEDISARKALEAELEARVEERTREIREANAALEAFGRSVAHDLRTPLRNVQTLAAALLDDYADQLDDEGRHLASRIVRTGEHMDRLITDLLEYSRLSRADIPRGPVDLSGVVGEARKILADAIRDADAVVTVDAPLPDVIGHRPTLVQMVTNLIENALKFVARGSRPEVRVSASREGKRVRLWVEDRGIGVPPADRERVFRPFERLHGEEAYPGIGIGLAIVRKGAERMGGRAGVEPRAGGGSRFWIELPADPAGGHDLSDGRTPEYAAGTPVA